MLFPIFFELSRGGGRGNPGRVNPIGDYTLNFRRRLELARRISREIKKALYEAGFMVESKGKSHEVVIVLPRGDLSEDKVKKLEEKPGVLILDEQELAGEN